MICEVLCFILFLVFYFLGGIGAVPLDAYLVCFFFPFHPGMLASGVGSFVPWKVAPLVL